MPVDPRPPLGGLSAAIPVLRPPAPPSAAAPAAMAAVSDFDSVMAQLRADLAGGATLPGAPPPPANPPIALNGLPPESPADPMAATGDAVAGAPAAPLDPEPLDPGPLANVAAVALEIPSEGAGAAPDWRGMDARDRTRAFVEGRQVQTTENGDTWLFGADGFGFGDLIDIVNPLQHIPIVSSIYRWITGDEISPGSAMAGGALFGGPLGFAGAVANAAFEEVTGDDIAGTAIAALTGDDGAGPGAGTSIAELPSHGFNRGREGDGPQAMPVAPAEALAAGPPAAEQLAVAPAMASPDPRDQGPGNGDDLPAGGGFPIVPAGPVTGQTDETPYALATPAAGPPAAGAAAPDIAAQMMLALDKYQALARERSLGSIPPPPQAAGGLYDSRL